MIAPAGAGAGAGRSRYRGAVRILNSGWLLLTAIVMLLIASRLLRSGSPVGLVLTLGVVLLTVAAVRSLSANRPDGPLHWRIVTRTASPRWRPAPRDVTPREERLAEPDAATIEPPARPAVVVVEPAAPIDDLEQRLTVLDRLRANGTITDAEYEAKRARLIAEF